MRLWITTLFAGLLCLGHLAAAEALSSASDLRAETRVLLSKTIVSICSAGMDSGSGIVVSASGLILTTSTLLKPDQAKFNVRFADGTACVSEIVAMDKETESALLRVKSTETSDFAFLPLGDSSKVKVGSAAISVGNPLDSILADHQVSVSFGTITGAYDVCSADAASHYCGPALETDAAINAGSEGGALIDDAGKVIGMTCLAVDRARMLGTAVPINRIKTAFEKELALAQTLEPEKWLELGGAAQALRKPQGVSDRATQALVKICAHAGKECSTGIVIDDVGHVLTSGAFSVGQQIDVELSAGKIVHAWVLRQSAGLDLSLLKLESAQKVAWIPLKEKASVVSGIRISVVATCALGETPSINSGIVSATDRFNGTAAQTDARLTAGNAGGAVLNRAGDLIGVVSHSKTMCQCSAQNAGVSFFTPAPQIRKWIEEANLVVDATAQFEEGH